jgi:hypothetical protein
LFCRLLHPACAIVISMANPDQLARLNEGVGAWNNWRVPNTARVPEPTDEKISRLTGSTRKETTTRPPGESSPSADRFQSLKSVFMRDGNQCLLVTEIDEKLLPGLHHTHVVTTQSIDQTRTRANTPARRPAFRSRSARSCHHDWGCWDSCLDSFTGVLSTGASGDERGPTGRFAI